MKILANVFQVLIIVALIPTTAACLLGAFLAIVMAVQAAFAGKVGSDGIMFLVFIVPCSFGVYSLWWLVFRFKTITFKNIPNYIKTGLGVGSFMSLLFTLPSTGVWHSSDGIYSAISQAKFSYYFSAPIVFVVILLLFSARNK